MSVKRWFANQSCVERLREILEDPVFQQACAVLQAANQPVAAVRMDPAEAAARYQWLAGFNDFERGLVMLTMYPEAQHGPTPTEWDYLTKPTPEHE